MIVFNPYTLLTQLLPLRLRSTSIIEYLKSVFKPIKHNYDSIIAHRNESILACNTNSQMLSLQSFMRKKVGNSGVWIKPGFGHEKTIIYRTSEDVVKPIVFRKNDAAGVGVDPVLFKLNDINFVDRVDFSVELASVNAQYVGLIDAIIKEYVFADKTYEIIIM